MAVHWPPQNYRRKSDNAVSNTFFHLPLRPHNEHLTRHLFAARTSAPRRRCRSTDPEAHPAGDLCTNFRTSTTFSSKVPQSKHSEAPRLRRTHLQVKDSTVPVPRDEPWTSPTRVRRSNSPLSASACRHTSNIYPPTKKKNKKKNTSTQVRALGQNDTWVCHIVHVGRQFDSLRTSNTLSLTSANSTATRSLIL